MRILDIYIGRKFLNFFFLIILILMVLFSLFELLAQLDDVGRGSYGLYNAFTFVALTLPKRLLDLMPISTLLGGILALGLLADHGELVAMEASGVSVLRICAAVLVTGLLLVLTSGILAEMVVPGMEQLARKSRSEALSVTGITLTRQGFWARKGNSYIHVDKMLSEGVAADLDIFEFDDRGRLLTFTHAKNADLQDNSQWVLNGIIQKTIVENEIITKRIETLTLDFFLSAHQVSILELPPYSLSTPNLIRYINALQQSGQNADQYSLALWRKLSVPLTTGAMVLLSLSFVFGSTRGLTAGYRITLGAFVGTVLYFADQMMMQWGLLLNLNPFFTAMIPVLLISGIAFGRLRKVF
ncbi:MAG: LPS export ABC transporter permease LptG [Desulfobulbaceae bacterium]|nr:LPS export ABC transporter permease LptG [Desulfobulbaceae bacterium]